MNIHNPEELQRREEVDRLLSLANVQRMREEFDAAEDTCRQVLELDTGNILASELLADLLHARGKVDEASAMYKAMMARDPKRVSVEEKYAKTVLEIAEREYMKQAAMEAFERPADIAGAKRSGAIAVLLSVLVPGVGHIFLGQVNKGVIILASFLLSWAVVALSPGTHMFTQQMGDYLKNPRVSVGINTIDPIAILCLGVGVFTYIYALIDASVIAGKSGKRDDSI